jgi:UMF1 family MFS transporter
MRAAPVAVPDAEPGGLAGAYRRVWVDLRAEWRRDPNLVRFLAASAIFRDGLVGVFTFGAVVGVTAYGVSAGNILLFGVAASVVAALGALAGGIADDRVGAKPVIVVSLCAMVLLTAALLSVSGPAAFWGLGLALCLFIGPTQSASRTMLLRMTGEGREGVVFGLYTMTGRAVAFLAPWMFALFVDAFDSVRAGLGGVAVVLAAGLAAMLTVRSPAPRTVS